MTKFFKILLILILLFLGNFAFAANINLLDSSYNQQEIENIINQMSAGSPLVVKLLEIASDEEKLREVLDSLSGSFLTNIMTMGARGDYFGMFQAMKIPVLSTTINTMTPGAKAIWFQGLYNELYFGSGNNQTLGNFISRGGRARVGKDLYYFLNGMFGIFAGYDRKELSQANNKADMDDFEFGTYGGLNIPLNSGYPVNIKWIVSGAYQEYRTLRKIDLPDFVFWPRAKINTYGARGAAEIEMRIKQNKVLLEYIPFVTVESGYIINDKYEETGGEYTALAAGASAYTRLETLGGLRIEGRNKNVKWYGKFFAGQLIVGARQKYSLSLSSYSSLGNMNIENDEMSELYGGAGFGIEYNFTKIKKIGIDEEFALTGLSLYFDIEGRFSKNLQSYGGQAGLIYKFPQKIRFVKPRVQKKYLESKDLIIRKKDL
ncbi:MAG: autotransporter outer membrane beta-barrel domain-containing protein [Elusimicrobiota bacterium]|jgi:uncharacterized protein with beta-barrel porin domain|nr:autotransporter outer membrane beta-barrel domain-containing protein [Elusimicrobiota bacterium]